MTAPDPLLLFASLLAGFTLAALLGERLTRPRPFDAHADEALAVVADRHPSSPRPVRCLACPNAPLVADFRAHTAVVHTPRALGPDDDPGFLATLGGAR